MLSVEHDLSSAFEISGAFEILMLEVAIAGFSSHSACTWVHVGARAGLCASARGAFVPIGARLKASPSFMGPIFLGKNIGPRRHQERVSALQ